MKGTCPIAAAGVLFLMLRSRGKGKRNDCCRMPISAKTRGEHGRVAVVVISNVFITHQRGACGECVGE